MSPLPLLVSTACVCILFSSCCCCFCRNYRQYWWDVLCGVILCRHRSSCSCLCSHECLCFVLCVDVNELSSQNVQELKWLEFPFLLLYWYLAGLVPIRKLDDCLSSGMIHVSGVITHLVLPPSFREIVKEHFKNECIEQLKIIESSEAHTSSLYQIDTKLLLEHIPLLDVNGSYMESSSAIPIKSFIA